MPIQRNIIGRVNEAADKAGGAPFNRTRKKKRKGINRRINVGAGNSVGLEGAGSKIEFEGGGGLVPSP